MMKEEWKIYNTDILKPHAGCFWQKRIKDDIWAEIYQYTIQDRTDFELNIQIPDDCSITGKTINITVFTYPKLDFKAIEKDAIKIIKNLIK